MVGCTIIMGCSLLYQIDGNLNKQKRRFLLGAFLVCFELLFLSCCLICCFYILLSLYSFINLNCFASCGSFWFISLFPPFFLLLVQFQFFLSHFLLLRSLYFYNCLHQMHYSNDLSLMHCKAIELGKTSRGQEVQELTQQLKSDQEQLVTQLSLLSFLKLGFYIAKSMLPPPYFFSIGWIFN